MYKYNKGILVSTACLATHLQESELCILDASWYLPIQNRNPYSEFESNHIPGAQYFDIDVICDVDSTLPHMMPSASMFSDAVGKLGIGNESKVVIYDGSGLMSAARVWWMFRAFGHTNVAVLDGGFPKWLSENRLTETGSSSKARNSFSAKLQEQLVRSFAEIHTNLQSGLEQVVDARSTDRYEGAVSEPRPGVQRGHIPGSYNVPYTDLLDPRTACIINEEKLRLRFETAGIDLSRPIITSCGSGVSAAVLSLALALLGHEDNSLYDGSWAEWGRISSGENSRIGNDQRD